jgi:hypothetical protein
LSFESVPIRDMSVPQLEIAADPRICGCDDSGRHFAAEDSRRKCL